MYIPDKKTSLTIILFARSAYDSVVGNLGEAQEIINKFSIYKEGGSIQRMFKIEAEQERQ